MDVSPELMTKLEEQYGKEEVARARQDAEELVKYMDETFETTADSPVADQIKEHREYIARAFAAMAWGEILDQQTAKRLSLFGARLDALEGLIRGLSTRLTVHLDPMEDLTGENPQPVA